jgi:hypothetical protein
MFDRATSKIKSKVFRAVYYGTMRDGVGSWACHVRNGNTSCGAGGYCTTLDDAKREAKAHAETHGVRAFYSRG